MSTPRPAVLVSVVLVLAGVVIHAGPCDIYAAGNTPCVAAHSTTRALYSNYAGSLYQVQRGSDNTTKNIGILSGSGGYANAAAQDTFCSGTTCVITTIFDQSGNNNHLSREYGLPGSASHGPGGYGDFLAAADAAPVSVNGNKVYGVFIGPSYGYRNNSAVNLAKGNEPEGIYAVLDGTHYNAYCCFDYGNAEVLEKDIGSAYNGHMETINFGNNSGWFDPHHGAGDGPWIQGDLENGLYTSNDSSLTNPNDPSITSRFLTAIVKGDSTDLWSIRGGDAQNGQLTTYWAGPRPDNGYYPMSKEGALVLGTGGDNSDSGTGTFYEGALTLGYPTDDVEAYLQADIVQNAIYKADQSEISGPAYTVGTTVSFLTQNSLGLGYLTHQNNSVQVSLLSSLTDAGREAATFYVRQGLSRPNCYSFESVDSPGDFLRVFANYPGEFPIFRVFLDPPTHNGHDVDGVLNTWSDDATFCPQVGFLNASTSSLRSFSYPTRYWRPLINGTIYQGANGGPFVSDDHLTFATQASWTVTSGLA